MKIKMLLQIGAYDKKWEDCFKLMDGLISGELLAWALKTVLPPKLKKVHKMADGTPFLVEFEKEELV